MIFSGTLLNVVDNTGALKAKCIHIYKRKKALLGDVILVSLKRVKPLSKVKKGQVIKGLLVNSNQPMCYLGGHIIKSGMNSIILLKNNSEILGSRFKGSIFYKLRDKGIKYLTLSSRVF